MVIWLIGLSGAGKTTVAESLCKRMREAGKPVVLVDGDQMRRLFRHDEQQHAHTVEGRRQNAARMTEVCRWLDTQDVNVVCSILSIFPEMRVENRTLFSDYFEVYLSVPMQVLEARDSKGLYAAARAGEIKNVVGIDIPFPEPESADLVIENHGDGMPPAQAAGLIMDALRANGRMRGTTTP